MLVGQWGGAPALAGGGAVQQRAKFSGQIRKFSGKKFGHRKIFR